MALGHSGRIVLSRVVRETSSEREYATRQLPSTEEPPARILTEKINTVTLHLVQVAIVTGSQQATSITDFLIILLTDSRYWKWN